MVKRNRYAKLAKRNCNVKLMKEVKMEQRPIVVEVDEKSESGGYEKGLSFYFSSEIQIEKLHYTGSNI